MFPLVIAGLLLGVLGSEKAIVESEPAFAAFPERSFNFTRTNRYETWQLYEVGRQGRFRPRVIVAPYGSFYLEDGRPYPWISNHPLDWMPSLVTP